MTKTTFDFNDGNESRSTSGNITFSSTSAATSLYHTTLTYGYTCHRCNGWVSNGVFHNCAWTYQPTYYYVQPTVTYYKQCGYCTGYGHEDPEQCPRVKSISYHEDGLIKKIKFHKS